ncbi:type III polyketide synthase [Paludibaculum fermentans]|uniref:Type III polyketide synthase n=1 Tax=Paludibaculum fermentans TaxID=1473598 RepID=A0A7S7SIA2_PALFE|nr:3-oxoacyl-[acyl-carrier-protein] synthase III C-terminal domain-containing protein [Paludibaculum fermentans]QOY85493.1 type III polyketide synthase [Paludibaculum fermentans]
MIIASAASALPKHKYDQRVLLAALKQFWGPKLDNPQFMERLHNRVGVETRHLALPMEQYYGIKTWGQANNHWIDVAVDLSEEALTLALERAGLDKSALGAIYFVSVTGIASPSVDARLMNRMSLPVHIKRIPIFGLGCVAGAAGVARAADYVKAYPKQVAAVIAVELCSLTLQHEDLSIANLISSGLFGDGAGIALVAGAEVPVSGPKILATRSVFYPNTEHVMGWDISEKGFQIVLSREVPEVVEQNLAGDVDAFLSTEGLTRADIGSWVLHTGGPRVLEATSTALQLPPDALDASWACLKRTGNLSSASVLLVLEEVMMNRRPQPGTYSLMAAMGPAFCSELILLRW